jgi:hypothetical protein
MEGSCEHGNESMGSVIMLVRSSVAAQLGPLKKVSAPMELVILYHNADCTQTLQRRVVGMS